jgi:hypothetical protein
VGWCPGEGPYSGEVCTTGVYATQSAGLSTAARDWAVANGDNPRLRIVLVGYEAEHAGRVPEGWTVHAYTRNRAYGTAAPASSAGNGARRHNERLWFSPHCLLPSAQTFFLTRLLASPSGRLPRRCTCRSGRWKSARSGSS